jgi:hypothetical protein
MTTSILTSLINLAVVKSDGENKKFGKYEVQELLGELYQRTSTNSRTETKILKFAEKNNLIIIIPEA